MPNSALVRIEFNSEKTLFVGANNFIYNDLIVVSHSKISEIGAAWTVTDTQKPAELSDWVNIVPAMDVWLNVKDDEFRYFATMTCIVINIVVSGGSALFLQEQK